MIIGTPLSTDSKSGTNVNFTAATYPGIYAIIDTTTGKGYYGESQELGIRLGHHRKELEKGRHDNEALQEAWDIVGNQSKFQWFILEWGPAWEKREDRQFKEKQIINANQANCFNTLKGSIPQITKGRNPKNPRNSKRPLIINNIRYKTARDAATKLNRSRTDIIRNLKDPQNLSTFYLPDEEYVGPAIFAEIETGEVLLFLSMEELLMSGYATTKGMIYGRIVSQSLRFSNWNYAELDADGKPSQKPYVLKASDKTYKQWLQENQ